MQPRFDYFYTRDRLQIRWGRWPAAESGTRGSIVYLSGRAEFMEKNAEAFERLSRAGFDLYTFDWRGQGLSARMLANSHKGYVQRFADYLEDLQLFMKRVFLPQAPSFRVLIGHSMGGHIALRYLHDHGSQVDRAVLVSPMFDINTYPLPRRFVGRVSRALVRAGLGRRYVLGAGDCRLASRKFAGNNLTHDPERFMDEIREIQKNPELALGGVTYQWLAAACDSIDTIHAAGYPEAVANPVLLVSGAYERIVSRRAHLRICRRLPDCHFVVINGAKHEILKETDALQQQFWQAFDRFVAM
ncbi:MAG: alpha/beta hydrolase [Desulfobacterales bacterium]|nr:alpha/beta hydrolase [Desulfobacterales bacterium]MBS3754670.1 alpha/beta hydrolase [Desulfobacterales bacterium]